MKCVTCSAEIPPQWVNAIQSGICPGCGGQLMHEETKILLSELSEAMKRMPNDPQGVAGWLLSNYQFRKIGDGIPTEKFHRQGQQPQQRNNDGGGTIGESNLKVDPTYEQFLKRTDAYKSLSNNPNLDKLRAERGGKLAAIAAAIQSTPDPYTDDTHTSAAAASNAELEDFRAYQQMQAAGIDPFAASAAATANAASSGIITPESLMLPQQAFGGGGGSGIFESDAPLLPQEIEMMKTPLGRAELERQRYKKIKAQDAIEAGGPSGNKGGGFWRV